jgi:dihydrofolate reductase
MKTTIIVAMDEDRGIGKDGGIPWNNPEDMRFFKFTTMHKVIVMGRKTWDSIPRGLPGRLPFVVTRRSHLTNALACHNIKMAVDVTRAASMFEDLYIIGGETIYRQALEEGLVDRVLISKIPGKHECDTFFPKLPESFYWQVTTTMPGGLQVETWINSEKKHGPV